MAIDTGGAFGSESVNHIRRIMRNSNIVLFDATTRTQFSGVINVPVDSTFLIVAYEIPDNVQAVLNIVSLATSDLPHACDTPCCIDIDVSTPILHRMPMVLGGKVWQVSADAPQLLIVLPGLYQLELSDESAIGQAIVLGVPTGKIPTVLPFGYAAGIAGE